MAATQARSPKTDTSPPTLPSPATDAASVVTQSSLTLLDRFSGTRAQQVAQAETELALDGPLEPLQVQQLSIEQEYGSRILARRRLLPFVQRTNSRYNAGWVHADICMRLEKFSDDVARGLSPRLMLLMPPRHGKSELASKNFPAWHLGRHPDHEFIACSYNLSLAMGFSRKVKQIMADDSYAGVFPKTKVDPNNQSAEEWGIENNRGAYVAAGIGGPITGKGATCLVIDDPCVAAGSVVRTARGLVAIERVQVGDLVLTHRGRWRAVLATFDQGFKDTIELSTITSKIRLTPEHKVYTSGGWLPAVEATDVYHELPTMRRPVELSSEGVLLGSLPRSIPAYSSQELRSVRSGVSAAQGVGSEILFGNLRSRLAARAPRTAMQWLRSLISFGQDCAEVLYAGLPSYALAAGAQGGEAGSRRDSHVSPQGAPSGTGAQRSTLRCLLGQLRAFAHLPAVLQRGLQKRCALVAHARQEEPELPAWAGDGGSPPHISQGTRAADARFAPELYGVQCDRPPVHASHGRGQAERYFHQLRGPVQLVPHTVSQDSQLVRAHVYDIEVEEDHSFVAEGFVVHNCKNAEEADSADGREKIWEWYLSTAYSRLAPGGGVLIIQTWWHDDDLAGRVQQMMASNPDDEDIDHFEVVKYPAIATQDEYLDDSTLEIVFEPSDVTSLLRTKGEALHPARYDLPKLNKIRALNRKGDGSDGRWWSALYQQNPVPDDGSYFTKDQFKRAAVPPLKRCNVVIAWDFAISEKKQNDWTVGSVLLQDDTDVLHVAEVLRFKSGDAFFIVESILDLSMKWMSPGQVIGVEDGQIYRAIATLLAKRMRERKMYPSIEVLKPITDKMARGRSLQGRMQQGMVSFNEKAEWYDTVKSEMLRFPAGVHDDCVDSLAWAAILAVGKEPPAKAMAKKVESWRDKLTGNPGTLSHMAA